MSFQQDDHRLSLGPFSEERGPKKYLIVYADTQSESEGQRLLQALLGVSGNYESELSTDFDSLKRRLKQVHHYRDLHVYVLLADSRDRLERLHSLGNLLEDRKIVLILPDDTRSTYAKGFQMYPRFVTLMPGGYEELCAVMTEMLRSKGV